MCLALLSICVYVDQFLVATGHQFTQIMESQMM